MRSTPPATRRATHSSTLSRYCTCQMLVSNQVDRKSTRLNSSHTEIYTLSLHDALPILGQGDHAINASGHQTSDTLVNAIPVLHLPDVGLEPGRSEEHTSELQSHRDLHSFPTRRSSDLRAGRPCDQRLRPPDERHTRQRYPGIAPARCWSRTR